MISYGADVCQGSNEELIDSFLQECVPLGKAKSEGTELPGGDLRLL